MKKSTIMLVTALVLMAGVASAGKVHLEKNVISFTPNAEGRSEFKMNPAKWKELVWAYNDDSIFLSNKHGKAVCNKGGINGSKGGVVYKFKSTSGKPMELEIMIKATFWHWGGRKITLYYSDVNNWTELSPMKGSLWAARPNTWETNPKWKRLDARFFWGGKPNKNGKNGNQTPIIGSVATTDGEFYIRVDISAIGDKPKNVPGSAVRLTGLSWMGDVEVE